MNKTKEESRSRNSFAIDHLQDFIDVGEKLKKLEIFGKDTVFTLIIGCSAHSPIPTNHFSKVINAIAKLVLIPNNIRTVWGGNISAILK
jgi:hypothetical protein